MKFSMFAIFTICLTAVGLAAAVCAESHGQNSFGQTKGSGFQFPGLGADQGAKQGSNSANADQGGWPKLPQLFGTAKAGDGGVPSTGQADAGKLFETMPNLNPFRDQTFPRPFQMSDQAKPKPFGTLPNLFGGNNSTGRTANSADKPNLIDQFNTKSKSLLDRTTGWAHRQQQGLKEKTMGVWGGAAAEANRAVPESSARNVAQQSMVQPSANDPANRLPAGNALSRYPLNHVTPTQPPIRSAANPGTESAMRF